MKTKKLTNMKAARARHDMTQAELAQKAGVSRQMVHMIEAGTSNPSIRIMNQISKALKTTIDELIK